MKKIIILLLAATSITSCYPKDKSSEKSKIVHDIFYEVSVELKEKYGLEAFSSTISAPEGKYLQLGLSVSKRGPLSKSEGRKLLLECTKIFLDTINNKKELHSYLDPSPFEINNIDFVILVKNEDGHSLYKPDISIFSMYKGNISFKYASPNQKYKLESESETYEESLRIVENENQKTRKFDL